MPHPGIPGDADSIGLGVRQTGLIKLDPPVQLPKEEEYPITSGQPHSFEAAICLEVDGQQLEQILDSILPPIEWEEANGVRWRQKISREPATRYDIVHLHKQLEFLLKQRQARPDGLCPVRQELFSQCFNELIRQIAINSPERGLLLLRVREEIRMTFGIYHALHETAIAFGIQEADQYIALKEEPSDQLEDLRRQKTMLEKAVEKLKEDLKHLEESFVHRREANDKIHWDKSQLIKRTQAMLKQHLEHVLVTPIDKGSDEEEDSDS